MVSLYEDKLTFIESNVLGDLMPCAIVKMAHLVLVLYLAARCSLLPELGGQVVLEEEEKLNMKMFSPES